MATVPPTSSKWIALLCVTVLIVSILLLISGFGGFSNGSDSLDELRALLDGSGFHEDASGSAANEYATGVSLLLAGGWNRKLLREYLSEDAAAPGADSLKVLSDATTRVIRGATFRDAGFPRTSALATKISIDSVTIDLTQFSLPGEAALVIARSRLGMQDQDGAIRVLRAVIAMGLHFMSSDDLILSSVGIRCVHHAIESLQRIAQDVGDSASNEIYSSALDALDIEFDKWKREANRPLSLRDTFELITQ